MSEYVLLCDMDILESPARNGTVRAYLAYELAHVQRLAIDQLAWRAARVQLLFTPIAPISDGTQSDGGQDTDMRVTMCYYYGDPLLAHMKPDSHHHLMTIPCEAPQHLCAAFQSEIQRGMYWLMLRLRDEPLVCRLTVDAAGAITERELVEVDTVSFAYKKA